jgi:hypothetical protein
MLRNINTRLVVGTVLGLLATIPYKVNADAQAGAAAEMARKAKAQCCHDQSAKGRRFRNHSRLSSLNSRYPGFVQ